MKTFFPPGIHSEPEQHSAAIAGIAYPYLLATLLDRESKFGKVN